MRSFDYAQDDKKIKGFTLIELLVVVLIIAILASIALPKYMVTRDRAYLSGLMTIGKNVNDALDRRSLFDDTPSVYALDRLDISFKNNAGGDCTGTTCRIKVSGKEYLLLPRLNHGGVTGRNYADFRSYTNNAFGILFVCTESYANTYNAGYRFRLDCNYIDYNSNVDEARCVRLANSLGSGCSIGDDYCLFN